LHKSDPGRTWANLPIQVPKRQRLSFHCFDFRSGEWSPHSVDLFWTDKWILGQRVSDLAPRLFAIIPKRIANNITVSEALTNRKWISDIIGALSVGAIVDYLQLWDLLSEVVLQPEVEDNHIFSLARDGKYSAKTTIEGFFAGSTVFGYYPLVWETWAPKSVVSSFGWLPTGDVGLWTDLPREGWITRRYASYVTRKKKP
jgi:hypothetical protein